MFIWLQNDFIPVGIVLIWLQAWLRSKIACVPQILSCLGHTKFSESANPRAEATSECQNGYLGTHVPVPNARCRYLYHRCQIKIRQVQLYQVPGTDELEYLCVWCTHRSKNSHDGLFWPVEIESTCNVLLNHSIDHAQYQFYCVRYPPFQTYQSGGKMGQISPAALPKHLVILGPV